MSIGWEEVRSQERRRGRSDLDISIARFTERGYPKELVCMGFKAGRAGQACRARKGKFISTDPGNRHCTYCAGWSE